MASREAVVTMLEGHLRMCSQPLTGLYVLCRIVRTNITENMDPHTWTEILPQHEKDILTGSTHLKVRTHIACSHHAFAPSCFDVASHSQAKGSHIQQSTPQ